MSAPELRQRGGSGSVVYEMGMLFGGHAAVNVDCDLDAPARQDGYPLWLVLRSQY